MSVQIFQDLLNLLKGYPVDGQITMVLYNHFGYLIYFRTAYKKGNFGISSNQIMEFFIQSCNNIHLAMMSNFKSSRL